MKPLRIFTPVWGHKHLILLQKALGQSLLWPKNHAAIAHARWTLFCHPSEIEQVCEIAGRIIPPEQIDTIEYPGSKDELTAKRGELMCGALCAVIKKCLVDGSQFMMATPDFIWSDGSIENMIQLASQRATCVAVPHPRVLPTILDFIHDTPRSSYDLVTLASKHPHRSWVSSEMGQNPSGTFKSGIMWRKIKPGIVTLQHRMPSPYVVNFIPADLEFFQRDDGLKRAAFGAWDHDWSCMLAKEQRHRIVLSSDIAFMAEVTSAQDNVPPPYPANNAWPDDFWLQDRDQPLLSHQLNRQYISTFRGEP